VRNQFGASIGGPLAVITRSFLPAMKASGKCGHPRPLRRPDALAHRGLLAAANDPSACTSASASGCVSVATDPRVQPFLALLPLRMALTMGMELET